MKTLLDTCMDWRYAQERKHELGEGHAEGEVNAMGNFEFLEMVSDGLSEILENMENMENMEPPEPTAPRADEVRLQELLKCESRLNAIREFCGYVENGSSAVVRISQDDTTGTWVASTGDAYRNGHSEYGATFSEMLDNLVDYVAKNPST